MAMTDLRALGAARDRRTPPPALLDEIRTTGRRRLRLAALSGVTVSVVVSVGVAVGVAGADRAAGGDRLVPSEPRPTASVADPHRPAPVSPAVPADPAAGAVVPPAGARPTDAAGSPLAGPVAASPDDPSARTSSPAPTPTADPDPPGVQDRTFRRPVRVE